MLDKSLRQGLCSSTVPIMGSVQSRVADSWLVRVPMPHRRIVEKVIVLKFAVETYLVVLRFTERVFEVVAVKNSAARSCYSCGKKKKY